MNHKNLEKQVSPKNVNYLHLTQIEEDYKTPWLTVLAFAPTEKWRRENGILVALS